MWIFLVLSYQSSQINMSVEHSTITNQNEQKLTDTLRLIVEGIRNQDLSQLQKIELGFDNMVSRNTLIWTVDCIVPSKTLLAWWIVKTLPSDLDRNNGGMIFKIGDIRSSYWRWKIEMRRTIFCFSLAVFCTRLSESEGKSMLASIFRMILPCLVCFLHRSSEQSIQQSLGNINTCFSTGLQSSCLIPTNLMYRMVIIWKPWSYWHLQRNLAINYLIRSARFLLTSLQFY